MTTILVTGVGAIIGYGILRSLREARPDVCLIGADIYEDAVGQIWSDHFEKAPLTSSPSYLAWIAAIVEKHRIDLVIPGIEQDVHFLSAHRAHLGQTTLALNSPVLVETCKDKWLLHKALLDRRDPSNIDTSISGSFDELSTAFGLPFILKPRLGYASKGLVKVSSRHDFNRVADELGSVLMAQPFIGNDNEEYTVGAFGDGEGRLLARIALRRTLSAQGATDKAWTVTESSLDETVERLFAAFKPIGPTNLQFRKTDAGWKLLEINPRISSSTSIRTAFGYNEANMCLSYFLEGCSIEQPALRQGTVMRYIEDAVKYDRTDL